MKSFQSYVVSVMVDDVEMIVPSSHRYIYVDEHGFANSFPGRPFKYDWSDAMAYKPAYKTDPDFGTSIGYAKGVKSGLYKLAKNGHRVNHGAVGIYQERA